MNKKLLLLLIPIMLLSSCFGRVKELNMLDTDEKKANNRMKVVIEAINNRDKDGLKAIFSKQALHEAHDIDRAIEYLFEHIQGDIVSWKSRGGLSIGEENNHGHKIKEIRSFFYIDTDKQKYIVFLFEYLEDTDHPDNVGLYTLRIIKEEDEETQWGYWQDMKIAGIYRPSEGTE